MGSLANEIEHIKDIKDIKDILDIANVLGMIKATIHELRITTFTKSFGLGRAVASCPEMMRFHEKPKEMVGVIQ